MSDLSESQLIDLKTRLLPFGAEWTRATGRELATVRDGVDFLAAMRGRDDFWAALEPHPIDLTALRALLPVDDARGRPEGRHAPDAPPASDLTGAGYLRSLGLTEDEIADITSGLDAPDFFDSAIRSAFAQGKPQSIARALERLLETDRDIVATQQYLKRVEGSRGVVRAVSAVMGIALLLVGTACSSQANQAPPTPEPPPARTAPTPAPASSTPTGSEPGSTPSPAPSPSPADPTPPAPASSPTAQPVPPPPPKPRPNRPRPPTARYKGVTPRRRARKRDVPA